MKLLIVEDEPRIGQYLRQGLAEAGFAVDLSDDGNEGEQLALGGDYDLLILDVMLPGRDGWQILRSVRRSGKADHQFATNLESCLLYTSDAADD